MMVKARITVLGGSHEIGKNCIVVEGEKDAVVIDCGIRIVRKELRDNEGDGDTNTLPDFNLLGKETQKKIRGVLITHSHLDHLAAVPEIAEYGWPLCMSPTSRQFLKQFIYNQAVDEAQRIYGREKTPASRRFINRQLAINLPPNVSEIGPYQKIEFASGRIKVFTLPVNHSVLSAMGLLVSVDEKNILHLGDFKFEGYEPEDRKRFETDLRAISKQHQIDLLVLDCLNATTPGFTPPERLVIQEIANIVRRNFREKRRTIVTFHASNQARMRLLADEVRDITGQSPACFGKAMFQSAKALGIEIAPLGTDNEVIFVTGCQGELEAKLWQMSRGLTKDEFLRLNPDDVVVFSSRCIPGNEDALRGLHYILPCHAIVNSGEIERLSLDRNRAQERLVHVSGHGASEDIKLAIQLLNPQKVLPYHCEKKDADYLRQQLPGFAIVDDKAIELA